MPGSLEIVRRGLDPTLAAEQPRSLRGVPRGFAHVSGGEVRDGTLWIDGEPVDPARTYRVAGTDWELGNYGGYADPGLEPRGGLDGTTIIREAIEDHLRRHPKIDPPEQRIHGTLL